MPLQSKFLAGYYDSPFIDRVDTGLGYLVAMDDDPDKAALYGGRGLQFPKTVMAGLWYLGFNWLDPVVGGGSTPEEAERHRALRQAISIAVDWEENIAIFQKTKECRHMDRFRPVSLAGGLTVRKLLILWCMKSTISR